jgi:hypothetical protein
MALRQALLEGPGTVRPGLSCERCGDEQPCDFSGSSMKFTLWSMFSGISMGCLWDFCGISNYGISMGFSRPWKSPIVSGFTNLPTPTTARVELLIYWRVYGIYMRFTNTYWIHMGCNPNKRYVFDHELFWNHEQNWWSKRQRQWFKQYINQWRCVWIRCK